MLPTSFTTFPIATTMSTISPIVSTSFAPTLSTYSSSIPLGMPLMTAPAVTTLGSTPSLSLLGTQFSSAPALTILSENMLPLNRGIVGFESPQSVASNPELESHIVFWSRVMSEHALFISLGIAGEGDQGLKQQAMDIHQKWEAFRSQFANIQQEPDAFQIAQFNELAEELRVFKTNIFIRLTSPTMNTPDAPNWAGWLFPSYIKHLLKELIFAIDRVNGKPIDPQEVAKFWNHIGQEHAATFEHLIDPTEKSMKSLYNKLATELEATPEYPMLLNMSLEGAKALDRYNENSRQLLFNNQIKSTIHPVLMEHVIREGKRAIVELSAIQQQNGMSVPASISQQQQQQMMFNQSQQQQQMLSNAMLLRGAPISTASSIPQYTTLPSRNGIVIGG